MLIKNKIKKWTFRITVSIVFISGFLLIIVLNPVLTYATRTIHQNFIIYHNRELDDVFFKKLDEAGKLLESSEYYQPGQQFDICVNDGSVYPSIMRAIRGPAFGWGFSNKVVFQGETDYKNNFTELNGYRWNFTQLLAHELTHCLQFEEFGLFKSNPIARIPSWKWEGYAEYISRQSKANNNLRKNIERLNIADKADAQSWEISLEDKTISPREYYNYWILIQYCMDVKRMNYTEVLDEPANEKSIKAEMTQWYSKTNK